MLVSELRGFRSGSVQVGRNAVLLRPFVWLVQMCEAIDCCGVLSLMLLLAFGSGGCGFAGVGEGDCDEA